MKKKFFHLIFATLCIACNNNSVNNYSSIHDSKSDRTANNDSSELAGLVHDYTNMYSLPYLSDSSYILGIDTFRITLRHTTLMDSSIVVPKKYVQIYGLDSFVTHNFASSLYVDRNGKTVVDKRIYKNDFSNYLDSNLNRFGVLLYPSVKTFVNSIQISYSVSVPLTDVGVGVSVVIEKDGTIVFKDR